jgi:hypothetical protein
MKPGSVLMFALALAIAVAGCSGGPKGGPSASPTGTSSIVDVSSSSSPGANGVGQIHGLVHDDELTALKGATVGIVDLKSTAVTDANGTFAFTSVPVGKHTVAVSLLGYREEAKTVEVAAGENASVDLTLTKIPILVNSYNTTYIYQGHMTCGTLLIPFCGAFQDADGPNPNNDIYAFTWNYTLEDIPTSEVLELVWTPTSASTGQHLDPLYFNNDPNDDTGVNSKTIWMDEGVSPMHHIVNGSELVSAYKAYNSSRFDFGVYPPLGEAVVDQKFTLYRTVFYGEAAREDFSALPK